ncbi:WD repeat-containing protein 27 [Branchiostoma belcheri]|nr:WD repeat-containing protein 27 [Branchiostoma belcheri]
MSAWLELTIPTATSPSHTQHSCNGTYLAVPHGKGEVGVWSLQDLGFKQLDLVAHRKAVTATSFGFHSQPTLLCTAAEDYIIVWNIEEARHMYEKGQQIRGQIIGQVLGYVQHVSFSPDDALIAACIGTEILVLDSQVRIYDLSDGSGFRLLHQVDIGKTISKWKAAKEDNRPREEKGPVTVSSRPTWQKPQSQDPGPQNDVTSGESEASAAILGLYYCRNIRSRQGTADALVFINAHTFETTSLLDFGDYIPSMVKDGPSQCNIPLAGSFAFGQGADRQQVWCLVGSLFQKSVDVLRLTVPAHEGLGQRLESLSLSSPVVDDGAGGEGGTVEISVLSSTPLSENSPLRSELVPRSKETSSGKQKQRGHLATKPKGQVGDQPLTFKSKVKSSGYTQEPRMKMFAPSTRPTKGSPTTNRAGTKSTGGDRYRRTPKVNYLHMVSAHIKDNMTPACDLRPDGVCRRRVSERGSWQGCVMGSGYCLLTCTAHIQVQVRIQVQRFRFRPGVREFPMASGPPVNLQKKLEAAERPTPINNITFSGNLPSHDLAT